METRLESFDIRKWKASCFDNLTKKWIYGGLDLLPRAVVFSQTQDTKNKLQTVFKLVLPFSTIIKIERSVSSMIFPCITISTSKDEKCWFSSLDDRDETLLFLRHFFQPVTTNENLSDIPMQENDGQSTYMGKELLRKVTDSRTTLTAAGVQLVEQGQQIRNASVTMLKLNNDLSVASRFTQGLKSWLPRWRIPKEYKKEDFFVLNENDVTSFYSTVALCCSISSSVSGPCSQCTVTIARDGLSIFLINFKMLYYFKWPDVSRIQVSSPWEISITQYLIGKSDHKCSVVSINMLLILQEVEKYLPDKVEYISPELETRWSELKTEFKDRKKRHKDNRVMRQHSLPLANGEDSSLDLDQPHSSTMPTDQEMTSISNELSGLKYLALAVQKEEDEQLKQIDELTGEVTKGSERLTKLNKTLKRLY